MPSEAPPGRGAGSRFSVGFHRLEHEEGEETRRLQHTQLSMINQCVGFRRVPSGDGSKAAGASSRLYQSQAAASKARTSTPHDGSAWAGGPGWGGGLAGRASARARAWVGVALRQAAAWVVLPHAAARPAIAAIPVARALARTAPRRAAGAGRLRDRRVRAKAARTWRRLARHSCAHDRG
jgi:hypothetical protein